MNARFRMFILLVILLIVVVFLSCEGPEGPPGLGVDDFDVIPPTITLQSPATGTEITTDTFTIAATASDNDAVLHVEFFLDASSSLDGLGRAIDSFPPYRVLWNLDSSGHGPGLHLLTARATDRSRNYTDTPTSWIQRAPFNRLTILYYDGTGALRTLAIPDEWGDRNFNVRFTPVKRCRLLQVFFEFANPEFVDPPFDGGCDIDVIVWTSNLFKLPADELLRLRIVEDSIAYDRWISIDLQDRDLIFDNDFHVGFSPAEEFYQYYYNNNFAMPMILNHDSTPLVNANNHRSSEYEGGPGGRGWGTMQSQWNNQKFDFHIRVLVDYFDETQEIIDPEGSHLPSPSTLNGELFWLNSDKIMPKSNNR